MDSRTEKFEKEQKEFLSFLKSRLNLFHQSNVFFRDIHYGVMAYLEMNNLHTPYTRAENLTRGVVVMLERKGILLRIDHQTFVLIYPEFKKPAVKPAPAAPAKPGATAPAKPAAAAAPASARPAPGTTAEPRPAQPTVASTTTGPVGT